MGNPILRVWPPEMARMGEGISFCCRQGNTLFTMCHIKCTHCIVKQTKRFVGSPCLKSLPGIKCGNTMTYVYHTCYWHQKASTKAAVPLTSRSPLVDEERLVPGHWLETVLCVSFSASMLLVGWQKEHSSCKSLCHLCPKIPLFLYT